MKVFTPCWAGALGVGLLFAVQVGAAPVAPGAFTAAVSETDPSPGTTTLFSTNVAWGTSFSFSGSLSSSVLANDVSNPFGGLTFTYELSIDANSPHAASQLTVGGYSSFLTDVSYQLAPGDVAPNLFSRSQESVGVGQNVRFHFLGPNIPGGQSSALLVVQTSAQVWDFSIASVINSSSYGDILTVAPINVVNPVPEPSGFALGLLGLLSAAWLRRIKAARK